LWVFLAGFYAAAAMGQDARPEVRLYVMDVPPYALIGSDRHGILGDVALEALKRSDFQAKIIETPNARALHDVPQLSNALIVPLARLKEREADFTWIARIVTVERAFFSMGRRVHSFVEAKKQFQRIGVERGSAAGAILRAHGFTDDRLVEVPLDAMAPKMLRAGRIDAWLGVVHAGDVTDPGLVKSPVPGASTEQYLACSKDCDAGLVKKLAEAVKAMDEDGTIRRIEAGY
jgi:polar amino acid transport system substrate-binding protein